MPRPIEWKRAHQRSLHLALGLVRESTDAEDVAQEALIRAWRHHNCLRDPDLFLPWLARITQREAARERDARRPAEELPDDLPTIDESLARVELRADLDRAVRVLDERERLLVRLRYEEDLTQPAIAARLGMPEGTVKVLLHRARRKLRLALES